MSTLATGRIDIEGRLPWSSNGTFLVTVTAESDEPGGEEPGGEKPGGVEPAGDCVPAVYKPGRGERPLWDFPDGLYRREAAAYELDQALGWRLVPETIVRADAPLGPGSVQLFVNADFEQHYFTLLEEESHHRALKQMAVFDVLANNADRKGGHCLLDAEGHVWGIDHGLCFHTQPKLRTVIWDFAGERVDPDDLGDISRLLEDGLPEGVTTLLHLDECRALVARARRLLDTGKLPRPRAERPYPWPLV